MDHKKIERYLRAVQESQILSSNPVVANALRTYRAKPDVASPTLQVRNLLKTGDKESPCGSWKDYWRMGGVVGGAFINTWPRLCSVCDCAEQAEHGAHVLNVKTGAIGIVPLCAGHNNPGNRQLMVLKNGTIFVPVTGKDA